MNISGIGAIFHYLSTNNAFTRERISANWSHQGLPNPACVCRTIGPQMRNNKEVVNYDMTKMMIYNAKNLAVLRTGFKTSNEDFINHPAFISFNCNWYICIGQLKLVSFIYKLEKYITCGNIYIVVRQWVLGFRH